MGVPWFKFNGIDSRDMGIIVTSVPEKAKPKRNITTVQIPGRSGALHIDEGTYNSYTQKISCKIKDRHKADLITAWLDGCGELILSSEPDKYYTAYIVAQWSIKSMLQRFQSFSVTFDVDPFKYSVNAFEDTINISSPITVFGKGSAQAAPMMTITGDGDITILINGREYVLKNVDEYVTIDSDAQEVFKDSESRNSLYYSMEFPRLDPGSNNISWTGAVSNIEIVPRWRWL